MKQIMKKKRQPDNPFFRLIPIGRGAICMESPFRLVFMLSLWISDCYTDLMSD